MIYRQIFARKKAEQQKLLALNPRLTNNSGIYIFIREENGFKYAYIGQALHLLDRLISHMQGYGQWIDLSIKKHKLWNINNPTGWKIKFFECSADKLDILEQQTILDYATAGFQLRNRTSGSQGKGKATITDTQRKGYLQGKNDGKIATLKQIKVYFDKYLDFVIKGKETKIKARKLQEFMELLYGSERTDTTKNQNT